MDALMAASSMSLFLRLPDLLSLRMAYRPTGRIHCNVLYQKAAWCSITYYVFIYQILTDIMNPRYLLPHFVASFRIFQKSQMLKIKGLAEGSVLHVMLGLHRRSGQVVVAYEHLDLDPQVFSG